MKNQRNGEKQDENVELRVQAQLSLHLAHV